MSTYPTKNLDILNQFYLLEIIVFKIGEVGISAMMTVVHSVSFSLLL